MAGSSQNQKSRERKLRLGRLFTDAPVRTEPEEPQKVLVAGMVEARPQKQYPDTFFGRAFKVFRGEFSTLFKSAISFMFFTIPFAVILFWFAGYFQTLTLGSTFNFMADIGVGYPGVGDSLSVSVAKLYWEVHEPVMLMLAAALIIASLGLSGLFYAAKRSFYQDFYKKSFRTYWMGFAKYWLKYLITAAIGILIASAIATATIHLLARQALGNANAGDYCAVVFTWIFGAPLMTVPVVMMGLYTAYDLTVAQTFKNALVIIANSPISVIVVTALSIAPMFLFLAGTFMSVVAFALWLFVGATLMALCMIALAARGMTKCHILLRQKQQEIKQQEKRQVKTADKKKKPVQYKNPKQYKKKKK